MTQAIPRARRTRTLAFGNSTVPRWTNSSPCSTRTSAWLPKPSRPDSGGASFHRGRRRIRRRRAWGHHSSRRGDVRRRDRGTVVNDHCEGGTEATSPAPAPRPAKLDPEQRNHAGRGQSRAGCGVLPEITHEGPGANRTRAFNCRCRWSICFYPEAPGVPARESGSMSTLAEMSR